MAGGEAEDAERRDVSQTLRAHPLSSRFCVSERLDCPVVHKNNTFFLHNRLRLGRDHKLIISLTHLPALRLDSFQFSAFQPRMHGPFAQPDWQSSGSAPAQPRSKPRPQLVSVHLVSHCRSGSTPFGMQPVHTDPYVTNANVDVLMAIRCNPPLRRDASQCRRSGDLAMLILHNSVLQIPRRGICMEVAATAQNDLGSVRTFLTDENGLGARFPPTAAQTCQLDLDRKYVRFETCLD